MSKKIYIYPTSSRDENLGLYNPYIDDLVKSLDRYFDFVNKDKPSSSGIFDLMKYLGKTDYVFFNWIEKLPENKGGSIQTLFLFSLFPILKLLNIKVIWVMHNKLSHTKEHLFLKKAIFRKMLRKASLILTHSSEGINYGESMVSGSKALIHYFPHPVKDRRKDNQLEYLYDILIWGTISPYKGIDKFLEFLHANNLENKYKILIVGKYTSENYFGQISKYANQNIQIQNKFIEDDMLRDLIKQSKIILFTYSKSSILSSGVLMDSIGYGANIIGPDVGAFTDLAKEGILNTFKDFSNIVPVINKQLDKSDNKSTTDEFDIFLKNNTWEKFAENVNKVLG
jgi:glycosyltransferase involved in cell wall biosynthesis